MDNNIFNKYKMKCYICNNQEIIKFGFNPGKVQKYKCLKCNKIFSYENRIPNTRVSADIVSLCFDLYFKGLSYRVIKQQILEQFKLKIGYTTIHYWIQTYTKMIKRYTDSLRPKLSLSWQMDETYLPFKGLYGSPQQRRSNGNWCWVAIDIKTRFVLETCLTLNKDRLCGEEFFSKVVRQKTKPKLILTDGNHAYCSCIIKYYPKVKHKKIKKLGQTSIIERFNGTIKNRTKTMRCFDSFNSCQNIIDAFKIYYNFLRPHTSLNGQTPAQAAGINIDLSKRWNTLFQKAFNHYS